MKPVFRTLAIYQGQTFKDQFLIVDDDRNPINLAGKTARMQVRESIENPQFLFELTTENGGITLGADGLLSFFISAVATAAMGGGSFDDQQWVFDLEVITAGAPPQVDRILTGVVTFSPEITR